jgi:hypothetical protein
MGISVALPTAHQRGGHAPSGVCTRPVSRVLTPGSLRTTPETSRSIYRGVSARTHVMHRCASLPQWSTGWTTPGEAPPGRCALLCPTTAMPTRAMRPSRHDGGQIVGGQARAASATPVDAGARTPSGGDSVASGP